MFLMSALLGRGADIRQILIENKIKCMLSMAINYLPIKLNSLLFFYFFTFLRFWKGVLRMVYIENTEFPFSNNLAYII